MSVPSIFTSCRIVGRVTDEMYRNPVSGSTAPAFQFVTMPVRMALSAEWPTIPMAIGVQILHAPLVLGLFIAVPIFLQEQARPTFRHSLQGLNATMILGLTRFIGPAIGSLVMASTSAGALDGLIRGLMLAGLCGAIAAAVFYSACKSRAVRAE